MIAFLQDQTKWSIEPIRDTEVAHFYWMTDINTHEIGDAFHRTVDGCLTKFVGPARVCGLTCIECADDVLVESRTQAKDRIKHLDEEDWGHRARWADPRICLKCKKDIYRQQQAQNLEERNAEQERKALLKTMPYREYLLTAEWQARRKEALRRAGYRCQTCAEPGKMHVHHRTYVNRGAERPSDLIVLCFKCHELFHENRRLADGGRAAA